MRSAPPVLVPVGRFVWGERLALAGALFTALACLLVAFLYRLQAAQLSVLLVVWLLAAGLAWVACRHEFLPAGELSWDGEAWWFRPSAGAQHRVVLEVSWDAGRAMLVRLQVDRAEGWTGRHTWLQASHMPLQWHGFRCAVYGGDTL